MNGLWPAAALLLAFLALLLAERLSLDAARRRVPLCVAVTGTRGKSSVTRLIAAALRADGRTVLAKTTGSRPVFSEAAGVEHPVPRMGPPTILEQKRVLRAAARTGREALVAEMMSIRPECLRAEAGRILKPDLLVITNARIDHREEMGPTADAAAAALAAAIIPGCTVLVPASEDHPAFHDAALRRGARLVLVPGPSGADERIAGPGEGLEVEFPENRILAAAAAAALGMSPERAAAGMAAAVPDFGALRVWRLRSAGTAGPRFAVSAFAANEPASTRRALDRLAAIRSGLPERRIGILALRETGRTAPANGWRPPRRAFSPASPESLSPAPPPRPGVCAGCCRPTLWSAPRAGPHPNPSWPRPKPEPGFTRPCSSAWAISSARAPP